MGLQIEDGKGTGRTTLVDADNKLGVRATIVTEMHEVSTVKGKGFMWASGTYNYDANDTILLVKNTSSDDLLEIEGIWLSGDTDTRVIIHIVTTDVTLSGTTITGTNLNTGSGNVAEATAARDEVNNTQGSIIWSGEIMAGDSPYYVNLAGAIILAKNSSIGVDYVTAGTACDVTIMGAYEDTV